MVYNLLCHTLSVAKLVYNRTKNSTVILHVTLVNAFTYTPEDKKVELLNTYMKTNLIVETIGLIKYS